MMGRKKIQDIGKQVAAMYPTMSSAEIAAELGITVSAVCYHGRRLGLKHTEETVARLRAKHLKGLRNWNTSADAKETWARTGRKISKMRRIDRLRVMSGKQQENRYSVAILPRQIKRAIYYLSSKYGYLYVAGRTTMWYDAQTIRAPREQYYTEKFGMRFVSVEKQEDE